ncbi:MAG: NUDIX hydrolase [Bacillota bacterium]
MLDITKFSGRQADILDIHKFTKFAVLLPVVEYNNEESILFEIRSSSLAVQPGEICFPGGRIETQDKDEKESALRETCEELGLTRSDINIIGPLDVLLTPFDTKISPFVGRLTDYTQITPNPSEVESIFYVPLKFFLENRPQTYYSNITISPPPDFPFHLLPNGKTYNWRKGKYPVHFYIYEDKVIWGITARILYNFIQIIKND